MAKADVLLQNLKPGALAKLGYPIKSLRRQFPRLVSCSISGYGEEGPYRERKAYDLLIQAESGLASITGGPEAPARVGVSVVDIATGMHAYEAILEALIARGRTGKGADIRVSMFDSMMEWMAIAMLYAEHGAPQKRLGLTHPTVAPYGVFQSGDGIPILISVQNDREWVVLCNQVLKRPQLATDPRFATSPARTANRAQTDAVVADYFASRPVEALSAELDAAQIAFARVNTVQDVLRHPQLRRVAVASPWGEFAVPASPARFMGEFGAGLRSAAGVGPAHGGGAARIPRICRITEGCRDKRPAPPCLALRPRYVEGAVVSRRRPDRSSHEDRDAPPYPAQGLPPAQLPDRRRRSRRVAASHPHPRTIAPELRPNPSVAKPGALRLDGELLELEFRAPRRAAPRRQRLQA